MAPGALIEREEKEKALALVEASSTFAKQDQLKSFLRFVCKYEIQGRGSDLHEYLIGTEVLGQKAGYSTAENSVVRSRAHSLRHKLLDFYATEGANSELRIEIPKGSYCPRFVRMASRDIDSGFSHDQTSMSARPAVSPGSPSLLGRWILIIATFVTACVVSALIGRHFAPQQNIQSVAPVIREAWGPLLNSNADAIICVATGPQLLVRSAPDDAMKGNVVPSEMNLEPWYNERFKLLPGDHLYVVPNYNTPLWGDASGAISVSKVLNRAGVDAQILPERVVDSFALKDRNVILLGRPEVSPAAALFLQGLYYNINWSNKALDVEVSYTDPRTGSTNELIHKENFVHGLITVIRSTSHEKGSTEMVILSGVNSAGTIAAAEFFSSPDQMQEFKNRLVHDGYKAFPAVYQILISAEADKFLPFKSSMETYKVITQ
jgi:hypothetical protein